jgi:hypothetical protein
VEIGGKDTGGQTGNEGRKKCSVLRQEKRGKSGTSPARNTKGIVQLETQKLRLIARRQFEKGERFCEPVYALPRFRPNPTFPELACRFLTRRRLPDKLCKTYDVTSNSENWEKRAPIGKQHYELLKKTACDPVLLDRAYDKWVEMAKHKNSNAQLNQLLQNALNWLDEKKNHEDLRRGSLGTDMEKEKFWADWMKKGMSAIRKDKRWKGFASEDCYEYQKLGLLGVVPYLDYRDVAQINEPDVDIDALLGPRDRD